MGNTGGKLRKLRKSLRRISFSKSKDNLNRNDTTRRSISLMNLSVLKKTVFHRNKSKSTTLVSDTPEAEYSKEDIDKDLHIIRRKSSSISSIKKSPIVDLDSSIEKLKQEEVNESDSEKSFNNTMEDTLNFEITNSRILDNEKTPKKQSLLFPPTQNLELTNETFHLNETKPETELISFRQDCSEVIALRKIDQTLSDIEQQIKLMSHDELLVNHATFKDQIHFLWIKSYDIKGSNEEIYPKKIETIEYSKKVLQNLRSKAFKQHDYSALEEKSDQVRRYL